MEKMVSLPLETDMTEYQDEQRETLAMIVKHLAGLEDHERRDLRKLIADYLSFRRAVDGFLDQYFSRLCTQTCYQDQSSACCSRDGIITFFADCVVNAMESSVEQLALLERRLTNAHQGDKCVYLGREGCFWQVKPLVCAMFLCGKAERQVLASHKPAREAWAALKEKEKSFRWPDRDVLFDDLEEIFIKAGLVSPLMYLHNSPGLLRIKALHSKPKP